MLIFIDESGHPHPNDPTTRPVVVAVCISDQNSRSISGRIHGLKRDILGRERIELKAVNLINRRTFRRKPEYVQFLDEFFSTLLNLPIDIFAMIMEGPFPAPIPNSPYLPNRFRFLVQRVELLAEEQDEMATLMFDGSAGLYGGVGWQFNGFLYRSDEGRASTHITDAPCFVDSQTSAGIQIADLVASVIRQYQEAELYRTAPPVGDLYLHAIRRWHRIIEQKVRDDLINHEGFERPALFRMVPGDL
ncbi:MAG: hypothetical protein BZY87_04100 [SAR202 cluster bacterium Io17-Chloro-G6]|nr:MAG: hypothetical protein BZY87_04100 [SAR202 cluster bacterium Io17-Chloro-G6]